MAIGYDERPTMIGNLTVVTGTWENGDTSIDLSSFLSEILMGTVIPSGTTEEACPVSIDGSTLHFTESGSVGGTWFAIGRRT